VRSTRYPQRDVTVHGMRLRYIDVPADRPEGAGLPLLLIHGLSSRIEEYDELLPRLTPRRRVLVVDLPGSGYSDKPDRPYTLAFYEDTLLGFLDAIGVATCHLAGGSLGGNLVLRLGHREPTRFPKLAAWAPAGAWEPFRHLPKLGRLLGGRLLFWPVVWGQSRYWYDPAWPGRRAALREAFAHYKEVMSQGFVRMYWEIALDQVEQSLFPRAPEIRQPTFLGWGDKDHGMNMGVGVKRLAKLLPQAELRIFPGARHSLANEVPGPLGDAVDGFFCRP
jgi:pimeloyl-ACP methyl ester carboxylesterase